MEEQNEKKPVIAMYDVRGIQKYIFKTEKVKDAIGASATVENIISDALKFAVRKKEINNFTLEWTDNKAPAPYDKNADEKDVYVLFIGGGNAFVLFKSRELCIEINMIMSKYVLENTYSLQLAVAFVDKTDNYANDYKNLFEQMNGIKANMPLSLPLGTLPVMKREVKTGYPLVSDEDGSTESKLKKKASKEKQKDIENQLKVFDNLVTMKGSDSMLAVVHIDGNNMGLRIRSCIENKTVYSEAVDEMRKISFNISNSYSEVFNDMSKKFNGKADNISGLEEKDNPYFVRKILTAGDDITYVCNARIAIATVEYYCREISRRTMTGNPKDVSEYGFSVCAGIAFMGSHYPFYDAYQVAENCCDSAKNYAKSHKNEDRVENFLDFQICRNVQSIDLDRVREKEYMTPTGENLLCRPYFVSTDISREWAEKNIPSEHTLDRLKEEILYFQNSSNIPRSFAKRLRNTYPLGKHETQLYYSFLKSRNWELPFNDNTPQNLYLEDEEGTVSAAFYDALELMDYYVDLSEFNKEDK